MIYTKVAGPKKLAIFVLSAILLRLELGTIMNQKKRLEDLKRILSIESKREEIQALEEEMKASDFWLNEKNSIEKSKLLKELKDQVKKFSDLEDLVAISTEGETELLDKEISELELEALFSGRFDRKGAILSFYAGAGGDDAQDWTEMLLRMYLRWAEANNVKSKILDQSKGGEAGIKAATVEFEGTNMYGRLKGESGVHRLVRQSPFNAKSLRQTSFALVQVMPEIETESDVVIDPSEIRIDTFRASGKGGQGVNTTDSAVRIKHLPAGIIVTCQNERSQLQNKETALKILRSRLAQLMIEQKKEKVDEIRGDYSSPEWGNQIRSYVLHPYKMVKDHRTDFETTNVDAVLDGDLNGFIESELRHFSNKN